MYFDYNFNGQGILDKVSVENVVSGTAIVFPEAPSRPTYQFLGWSQEDGDILTAGAKYEDLHYVDIPGEGGQSIQKIAFLYAQWDGNIYTVTFDLAGGTGTASNLKLAWEDVVTLPTAPTKEGYTFAGWKVGNTSVQSGAKYSQLVADDTVMSVALVAQWTKIDEPTPPVVIPPVVTPPSGGDDGGSGGGSTGGTGGSTGGGGSSGGGTTTPPSVKPEPETPEPVPPVIDPETGKVTVIIPVDPEDPQVGKEDIEQTDPGDHLVVQVPGSTTDLKLDRDALQAVADSKADTFTLVTDGVILTFDQNAIAHILTQVSTYTVFSVAKPDNLSPEALEMFGNRPFFNLAVLDGFGREIPHFADGLVKVSLVYNPSADKVHENIVAGRVLDDGTPEYQLKSLFDGTHLQWVGNDLGIFGIAYRELTGTLKDADDHYASRFLYFTDCRELYNMTTEVFADEQINRYMYVAILGILEGIDPADYAGIQVFDDVPADSPFAPYVAWANRVGISDGMGNNKFGGNSQITREQMAVMLEEYIKTLDVQLPTINETSRYNDQINIASWAANSVEYVQSVGLMEGTPNNAFLPAGLSTYGEHAVSIYRLVECLLSINTVYLG